MGNGCVSDPELVKVGIMVLTKNMGVARGENVLIITDNEKRDIGEALYQAALDLGAEAVMITMKPRSRNAEEPPTTVASAWAEADVFLAPARFSLTHTQARMRATSRGARGATMPNITRDMFLRTLSIDYRGEVVPLCEKLYRALKDSREVVVTSPSGTNLRFSVEGREFHIDTGIYDRPGSWGNLPAGEVYTAPVEGTGEGVAVFDGSFSGGLGIPRSPVRIFVKKGRISRIEGGPEARKLEDLLKSVGREEALNFPAELGIGCNPAARISGIVLEDEKVYGTLHLAIGDNSTFGGKSVAGIHIDGVLLNPTLSADGRVIVERGSWRI